MAETKVCVVGLGYVGLPLAIEFAKYFPTTGFDISKRRIEELKKGKDRTNEVEDGVISRTKLEFTNDEKRIKECSFIVVAVPTPITKEKKPDLKYVESASSVVGKNLKKGAVVVYESTVWPGVTEDICVPILEKESGLKWKKDFNVGYSPERINPGDKEHTIEKIVKVISGDSEESANRIAEIYGKIIKAGVFKAKDIKTAEAAKVIENIQRDLNIALANELSIIFHRLGIETKDVLAAASTKWNFHRYTPGLVGGHCIGVDPYYLTFKAEQLGYKPKVILSGRGVNEYMSAFVKELVKKLLEENGKKLKGAKVLLLGLTFKENVKDARNSKALELINHLKEEGADVSAYDPLLEDEDVTNIFGVENVNFDKAGRVDAVILVTPHKEFRSITLDRLKEKMDKPVLMDVKCFYDKKEALGKGFKYECL